MRRRLEVSIDTRIDIQDGRVLALTGSSVIHNVTEDEVRSDPRNRASVAGTMRAKEGEGRFCNLCKDLGWGRTSKKMQRGRLAG